MGQTAPGTAHPDPIFNKEEPRSKPQKSTQLLWQFFLFPLLIVVAALGVFLLFGAFTGTDASPHDLLRTVLEGGENERAQAAHQLALVVNEAWRTYERDPEEIPFYVDPAFRADLRRALVRAVEERDTEVFQVLLARITGLVDDPRGVPLLEEMLYPPAGSMPRDEVVRRGAAQGLMLMYTPAATAPLVRAAGDAEDPQVRSIALNALARERTDASGKEPGADAVLAALRGALEDPLPGARLNAAIALARRGVDEPTVRGLVARSLTREGLAELDIPLALQQAALRNAAKAAVALGGKKLKALVERLTHSDREQDPAVRQVARQALDRWPSGQEG